MMNPYALLTPEIIRSMLKQPMYFVRQQYPRGRFLYDPPEAESLLLTHYAVHEIDRERAERHIRRLLKDPFRFLYDSRNPEHLDRLMRSAEQPEGYRVYINLLPQKWKAGPVLKLKINRYVREKVPWWDYSPSHKLNVTLKERYGELFIALLWKGQQTEVALEEVVEG